MLSCLILSGEKESQVMGICQKTETADLVFLQFWLFYLLIFDLFIELL